MSPRRQWSIAVLKYRKMTIKHLGPLGAGQIWSTWVSLTFFNLVKQFTCIWYMLQ